MDFSVIVDLIKSNSYFIIFLLMIIEGPFVTLIASLFANLGYFNVFIILFLSVLADLISDIFLFYLNKFDKNDYFKNKINRKKYGTKQIEHIKIKLIKHPFKSLFLIKFTPAIAAIGIIIFGTTTFKLPKFILYSTIISTINKIIYVSIGYFSGFSISYIVENMQYFQFLIPVFVIIVFSIIYIVNKKLSKNIIYFK